MELIVALIVILGSSYYGVTSAENDKEKTAIAVLESSESTKIESSRDYIQGNGYLIKDLTVTHGLPEGCHRPVLTTDLSAPSEDGVRNVKEVITSCEG